MMGETEVDEAHAETELAAFVQQMGEQQHDHQPNADPNAAGTEAAEAMDDEVDDDRLTPPLQVYPDPNVTRPCSFQAAIDAEMADETQEQAPAAEAPLQPPPPPLQPQQPPPQPQQPPPPPPPPPQQRPRSYLVEQLKLREQVALRVR